MKLSAIWSRRSAAALALLVGLASTPMGQSVHVSAATTKAALSTSTCQLANGIQHVIFLEFDNAHFERDIARNGSTNVPSDLEQMPSLYNFLKSNGTILTNFHTPLISHTSDDISASESGLYPGNNGVAQSANSYYEYVGGAAKATKQTGFTYWTSATADGTPNFIGQNGQQPPAPWAPYTKAGCNVGAISMSGMVVENKTDVGSIFGTSGPAYNDSSSYNTSHSIITQTGDLTADYEGLAIHCSQQDSASGMCTAANGGVADQLPNEPGGYTGYNGLFGNVPIVQSLRNTGVFTSGQSITDLYGNVQCDYFGGNCNTGFPYFNMPPQDALATTALMQEHGVPVTYAYIITPHNPQQSDTPYGYNGGPGASTSAYAPGEAQYVKQLKDYDTAFATFFQRLANDGINSSNTLFVVTSDEQDHHISETPTPANCDGVTIPCTYPTVSSAGLLSTSFGELALNLTGALVAENPSLTVSTNLQVNADDAPDLYLPNNPSVSDPTTRQYERATAALTQTNLLTATANVLNSTSIPAVENVAQYLADQNEYRMMHMYVVGDPTRNATYTAFGQPDYYMSYGGTAACSLAIAAGTSGPCQTQNNGFNWDHGDVQPQISTSWLGLVGPGVKNLGINGLTPAQEAVATQQTPLDAAKNIPGIWADHVDIRPTMLALIGLKDNIQEDGRVISEVINDSALPSGIAADRTDFENLAHAYKQCNAPLGQFNQQTLITDTMALASGSSSDDSTFNTMTGQLNSLRTQRDAIAGDGDSTTTPPGSPNTMQTLLQSAAFSGTAISPTTASSLIAACAAFGVNIASGPGNLPTPELGSGDLVLVGVFPILVGLYLSRRRRRNAR